MGEGVSPYLLEVLIDGQRIDWFKFDGTPSGTWSHDDWTVCKRKRIHAGIPDDEHLIEVRLVAAESDACLLRITQKERELAPD